MRPYEVTGTYGRSRKTKATIYVYPTSSGFWYAAEGSVNVNCTADEIPEGVDIEELRDHDHFTWNAPITSLEDLEKAVEE